MNYREYSEMIREVPEAEIAEYRPAFMWPHRERMPLAAISLGEGSGPVVKLPRKVRNSFGWEVPVIAFSSGLFRGNESLTDIVLHSGISRIPDRAFAGCTGLKRTTIPKRVRRIGPGTFAGCTALEDVYYEGTAEEWDRIDIVHYRHEVEFGDLIPGTPVDQVMAERRVFLPGNEALFTANLHFLCDLEKGASVDLRITVAGKDATDIFRIP